MANANGKGSKTVWVVQWYVGNVGWRHCQSYTNQAAARAACLELRSVGLNCRVV